MFDFPLIFLFAGAHFKRENSKHIPQAKRWMERIDRLSINLLERLMIDELELMELN